MAKNRIDELHSYVNPRFDVAFRKLFSEEIPEITINLLNTILGFSDKDKIVKIKFQDSTRPPENAKFRSTVQDLLCTDQNNRQYLVELQVANQRYFFKRMLYYFSRMYASQMAPGDIFLDLKPAYSVGILDFELFPYTDRYHTVHKICDVGEKNVQVSVDEVEFHMLELSKFKKTAEECKTTLDQWLFFFKHSERMKDVPSSISDPTVRLAFDRIDEFNWNQRERMANDSELKAWRDGYSQLATAHEDGLTKGIAKGLAEGERLAKLEMAKKMLSEGLSLETISKLTGLPVSEIKKN